MLDSIKELLYYASKESKCTGITLTREQAMFLHDLLQKKEVSDATRFDFATWYDDITYNRGN